MSKRYLLFFSFLFIVSSATGQEADSLWAVVQDEEADPKDRIRSLHQLSRGMMYQNPDSAIVLAEMEFALAEQIGDSILMSSALNIQGGIFMVQSAFAESMDRFQRMLEIRLDLRDTAGIAAAYNNIGNVYYYLGDYTPALTNYIRSLHFEQLRNAEEGLATSYINIGSIYALQDEFPQALDYFKRALAIYERNQVRHGMGSCYSNLGNIYKSLDSLTLAQEYYQKAVPIMEAENDYYTLAIVYDNIAEAYKNAGDYDKMFASYTESERLRTEIGDRLGLARLYGGRGTTRFFLNDYAIAREECQRSLEIASTFQSHTLMRNACECLYKVYKAQGQNELALASFELLSKLKDSVALDETKAQLRLMEFHEQVVEDSLSRVQEKAAFASAIKRQHRKGNVFLTIGIIFLVLSIILFLIFRRTRKNRDVLAAQKERTDEVLLNILPPAVAQELIKNGEIKAQEFPSVAVLFTDFEGFTHATEQLHPQQILTELNHIYRKFDEIITRHGVLKIKSIGDSYMAAGGLPVSSQETTRQTVLAALEMQHFVHTYNQNKTSATDFRLRMRVGIHVGPVIAGIAGFKNFQYDIWGDTVNLASRMEEAGEPDKVNVSAATYEILKDHASFSFSPRGPVPVRGKGLQEMWFIEKPTEAS